MSYGWLIYASRNRANIIMSMLSTCAKCDGHLFELSQQEPAGSKFKIQFVQCSKCGSPIGAMEYFNSGAKLENLEKQVIQLGGRLNDIQNALTNIQNSLKGMR